MGACFKKTNKPNSNTINKKNATENETNKPPETHQIDNNKEKEAKTEEQIKEKEPQKKTSKKPMKKGKSKKNLKINTKLGEDKSPPKKSNSNPAIFPFEQEIEKMQEIIKVKQEIIKKKNLELEEISANHNIFLKDIKDVPSANLKSNLDSPDLMNERLKTFKRVIEKNLEANKNLDSIHKELESVSVGLRKGSVSSEEIRSSVKKALSKMAKFDKEIQNLRSANSVNSDEFSFSPLKIPKANSKIITNSDLKGNVDTPLLILRRVLQEQNNEMDERNIILEKAKKGEANEFELKKYQEVIEKEIIQLQTIDLDKLDILGYEKEAN